MRIGPEPYDELVRLARAGSPHEVCGILSGETDDGTATVRTIHPVENVAAHPRVAYELDTEEQLAVMESIESDGGEIVGFYHSHPAGPPGPSRTDRAQATWSGYRYVIVSLGSEPSVGCWRWTGDAFEDEPVVVE